MGRKTKNPRKDPLDSDFLSEEAQAVIRTKQALKKQGIDLDDQAIREALARKKVEEDQAAQEAALAESQKLPARSNFFAAEDGEPDHQLQARRAEKQITPKNYYSPLTPAEVTELRSRIFDIVQEQTANVSEVFSGRRNWSTVQLRLYAKLIDKCVPDLKHVEKEVPTERLEELSVEQLERIVANAKLIQGEHIHEE